MQTAACALSRTLLSVALAVWTATSCPGVTSQGPLSGAGDFASSDFALSIDTQPENVTVTPGDTANFSVNASGDPPLFYQWRKDGRNIEGATNQSYSIPLVGSQDQGSYTVLVSNLTSNLLSSNATLLVGFYPIIIATQPLGQMVNEGSPASLTVAVGGASPYFFQWFKDGLLLSGATNQTLELPSVSTADMGLYFVLVSDRFSSAVSSEVALNVSSASAPGTTLLRSSDFWRYFQAGASPGLGWNQPAFVDSAWPSGPGIFANLYGAVSQPAQTVLSYSAVDGSWVNSYYFRTHFNFPFPTTNVFLIASNLIEDGAVYYLNGVELGRLRMAAGPVDYSTPAATGVGDGLSYEVLSFPGSALVEGDNVLAVEIHEAADGFGAVFGFSLKAVGRNSEFARISLPPTEQSVNEEQSAWFTAEVFGTPPFSFQWYKDGQPLPGGTNQDLTIPGVHSFDEGVYSLSAGNRYNTVLSSGARLTVIRDLIPPSVASVMANDLSTIVVAFSEPVDPGRAIDSASYLFSPGLTITGLKLLNAVTVVITTAPRDPLLDYSLVIQGVGDRAFPPNVMAPDGPRPLRRRNSPTRGALAGIQTVFFIIFENQDWAAIHGSTNCPYINSLLPEASWCGNYHAYQNQHPSQPSYIRLEAGTDFGYGDDEGPSVDRLTTTNHLVTYLHNAGIEWRGYMESLPFGATGVDNSGEYVGRHNPFAFFDDVTTDYSFCTNHIRPYADFAGDLAGGQIGRYNFITPNLTNDMHDLAPGSHSQTHQGDVWLSQELPRILNSTAFSNNGAVFITWDESLGSTRNPIGIIVLSPLAKGAGYQSTNYYDHSSTLRTMQDIFGVGPYLGLAAGATNLSELFCSLTITPKRLNGLTSITLSDLPVGKIHFLQASADLVTWATISLVAVELPSETIMVTDPDPGLHQQRFYRLVEQP